MVFVGRRCFTAYSGFPTVSLANYGKGKMLKPL